MSGDQPKGVIRRLMMSATGKSQLTPTCRSVIFRRCAVLEERVVLVIEDDKAVA
jgi:hypothetical protein